MRVLYNLHKPVKFDWSDAGLTADIAVRWGDNFTHVKDLSLTENNFDIDIGNGFVDVSLILDNSWSSLNGIELSVGYGTPIGGFGNTVADSKVFAFTDTELGIIRQKVLTGISKWISLKLNNPLNTYLEYLALKPAGNDIDLVYNIAEFSSNLAIINPISAVPKIVYSKFITKFNKDYDTERYYETNTVIESKK